MLKLLGFGGGAPMVCGDVRGSGEKWMIEKSVTLCCVCLCKDNKDKTQVNPKNCQTLFFPIILRDREALLPHDCKVEIGSRNFF